MAKFGVCLSMLVEKTAMVQVEADDIQGAIDAARALDLDSLAWEDGDWGEGPEAYAVYDLAQIGPDDDGLVWEPGDQL